MDEILFCDDCEYLSCTEEEQQHGQDHICKITDMRVKHFQYHPHILRMDVCREKGWYSQREVLKEDK